MKITKKFKKSALYGHVPNTAEKQGPIDHHSTGQNRFETYCKV